MLGCFLQAAGMARLGMGGCWLVWLATKPSFERETILLCRCHL